MARMDRYVHSLTPLTKFFFSSPATQLVFCFNLSLIRQNLQKYQAPDRQDSPFSLTRANWLLNSICVIPIFLILINSFSAGAQTILNHTPDPADYSVAFARAHWATSINKGLVFFGNSNPIGGDNSVRAFDPVSNSWEYLWPKGYTNGGPQMRDNHASFYVPRLDELWVWGGSHLETLPGALRSGRFSVSQKKWLATSTTDEGAFEGVVKNFGGFLIDPAMAWSAEADMGWVFGGSDQGNASNRYWVIEPNSPGPQPYKMNEVIGGIRPPPRAQASNLMVAVGSDF